MNLNRALHAIHILTNQIAGDVSSKEISLARCSQLMRMADAVSRNTTNSGLQQIMSHLSRAINAAAEAGNLDENWRKAQRYMQVATTAATRALSFSNTKSAKARRHVIKAARKLGVPREGMMLNEYLRQAFTHMGKVNSILASVARAGAYNYGQRDAMQDAVTKIENALGAFNGYNEARLAISALYKMETSFTNQNYAGAQMWVRGALDEMRQLQARLKQEPIYKR